MVSLKPLTSVAAETARAAKPKRAPRIRVKNSELIDSARAAEEKLAQLKAAQRQKIKNFFAAPFRAIGNFTGQKYNGAKATVGSAAKATSEQAAEVSASVGSARKATVDRAARVSASVGSARKATVENVVKFSETTGKRGKAILGSIANAYTSTKNGILGTPARIVKGLENARTAIADREFARVQTERTVGSSLEIKVQRQRDKVLSAILSPRKTVSEKLAVINHNIAARENIRVSAESRTGTTLTMQLGRAKDAVISGVINPKKALSPLLTPFKKLQEIAAKSQEKRELEARLAPGNKKVRENLKAIADRKAADIKAKEDAQTAAIRAERDASKAKRNKIRKDMRDHAIVQIKFDTKRIATNAVTGVANGVTSTAKSISKTAGEVKTATTAKAAKLYETSGLKDIADTRKEIQQAEQDAAKLLKADRALSSSKQYQGLLTTKEGLGEQMAAAKGILNQKASVSKTAASKIAKENSLAEKFRNKEDEIRRIEAQIKTTKGKGATTIKASLGQSKKALELELIATSKKLTEIATLKANKAQRAAELKQAKAAVTAIETELAANEKSLLKFPAYKEAREAEAKAQVKKAEANKKETELKKQIAKLTPKAKSSAPAKAAPQAIESNVPYVLAGEGKPGLPGIVRPKW